MSDLEPVCIYTPSALHVSAAGLRCVHEVHYTNEFLGSCFCLKAVGSTRRAQSEANPTCQLKNIKII